MAERHRLAGKIGGFSLRATHSPDTYTLAGRRAFLDRFLPTAPGLSEAERQARAEAALKAHMLKLAMRSARVRAQGKQEVKQ
jgi:hypothetical protein